MSSVFLCVVRYVAVLGILFGLAPSRVQADLQPMWDTHWRDVFAMSLAPCPADPDERLGSVTPQIIATIDPCAVTGIAQAYSLDEGTATAVWRQSWNSYTSIQEFYSSEIENMCAQRSAIDSKENLSRRMNKIQESLRSEKRRHWGMLLESLDPSSATNMASTVESRRLMTEDYQPVIYGFELQLESLDTFLGNVCSEIPAR